MDHIVSQPSSAHRPRCVVLVWGVILLAWFVALCLVHDPRPLGAPEWSVVAMQSLLGLSGPAARATATIVLRGTGMGILGILVSLAFREVRLRYAAPLVFV